MIDQMRQSQQSQDLSSQRKLLHSQSTKNPQSSSFLALKSSLSPIQESSMKKYRQQFMKIESRKRLRECLRDVMDGRIRDKLLQEQLQYDYERSFIPITKENQGRFEPQERVGPYRHNIKRPLAQIKGILRLDGTAELSCNKFTPQQIMAMLHSSKPYDHEQNIVHLTSLYVASSRVSKIIHFMQFKKWNRLKVLNIGANYVESVELLCRVELDALEDVYIWNNNLTSLRSLKRNKWPNLRTLEFHGNYITEAQDLRFLGNPKLKYIVFDSNLVTNFNEAIVMCSQSPESKISAASNLIIKWMGRPSERMRMKAIQVKPCTLKVKYI